MKRKLKTHGMFRTLSIPLPPGEQEALEKSLVNDGCVEPVTVWEDVIIDGYKRYRFCEDEGIDYAIKDITFSSEEEAVSWICRKHIPMYEQQTPQYRYLAGRLYNAQKDLYHEDRKLPEELRTVHLDPTWDRFSFVLAEELHINRASVEAYGAYAHALDKIAEKAWILFQKILSGEVKVTLKETRACAAMGEKKLKDYCRERWSLEVVPDRAERIRNRPKKEPELVHADSTPLSVRIKEMPTYDPDMEVRGLTLTIPAWMTMIRRVEGKTGRATAPAKEQLALSLRGLKEQINELLGEMEHGYSESDRTAEAMHPGRDL